MATWLRSAVTTRPWTTLRAGATPAARRSVPRDPTTRTTPRGGGGMAQPCRHLWRRRATKIGIPLARGLPGVLASVRCTFLEGKPSAWSRGEAFGVHPCGASHRADIGTKTVADRL